MNTGMVIQERTGLRDFFLIIVTHGVCWGAQEFNLQEVRKGALFYLVRLIIHSNAKVLFESSKSLGLPEELPRTCVPGVSSQFVFLINQGRVVDSRRRH